MRAFEYLVTSRSRRALLGCLWLDEIRGSVSDLARATGLGFATVHRELQAMEAAGLASAERSGSASIYSARRSHPDAETLTRLLAPPEQVEGQEVNGVPDALAALLRGLRPRDGRSIEETLVDGLVAAHRSASVARALPCAFWRQRETIDFHRLRREAIRRNERQALGLYLELTGRLGADARLSRRAWTLRDRRRTTPRPFFTSGEPAGERSLPLARRWGFFLPIELDAFVAAFRGERG